MGKKKWPFKEKKKRSVVVAVLESGTGYEMKHRATCSTYDEKEQWSRHRLVCAFLAPSLTSTFFFFLSSVERAVSGSIYFLFHYFFSLFF